MSYTQPILTQDQIISISDYINTYRANHQAPPILWDATIAKFSQQWTYYMSYHNIFQHSGTASYGENISYLQGYGTDILMLIKKSIDSWYNEVSGYDYNNPGFTKETGHFTCLVWKSSTTFGIGITINDKTNEAYISFNTFPPGNYSGQFKQNVLPALSPPLLPGVPTPILPPTTVPVVPPIPNIPTVPPTTVPVVQPTPTQTQSTRSKINAELYKVMRANNLNYPKASILNSLNSIINSITNDPNF
jgi:uncharacterized protein YkwD